ncbi:carbohydrate ABC transporter permease [Anaerocolumna chitinilytica]|uniref:ABC transporter permease n=1 Tax=Anaerocolumna chitinilytica TaxID=1727145 RepID=A0A7I8DLZ2_9FIRM|nr:sugar ABC transporter permease [Anaerocolumna chitinilytica]BCJ99332.1 ABC transporter permease [Anaerocolumna chitinilytica]
MAFYNRVASPKGSGLKKRASRDKLSTFFLLLPYGLLFFTFIAVPVGMAIGLSFTYFDSINPPRFDGLLNYITLITQDEVFLKYVLPNTLEYAIIVGPGGYVLSFLLAWMLAQIQPIPRTLLSLALYTPSMVGQVFIGVIWTTIFSGDQRGILNHILIQLGMINQPIQFLLSADYIMQVMIFVSLWSSMGIGFLAMISGILNINEELYEAAYVDGLKNRFQEIIYITIPSMKPQMLFGAVMAIVNAFNMGWIGVKLSGSNPTPGYAGQLITNHIDDYGFLRYEMGYAAAASVVLLLIVTLFSKVAHSLFGEKE